MLSAELVKQDCQTFHAEGDADLLIVQKAVESCLREDTALVGDDTDLLILLVHHIPFQSKNLYFTPEPKKNAKEIKVWNIRELKAGLGPEVCENILFIHAFLGCDTTSRIYGVGKGLLLKKIKTNSKLKQAAKEFYALDANPSHIADAGEEVFKIIYNAKENESLDTARYRKFHEKVATGLSHVEPQSLPPTKAAAKYHSYRVYLQICDWTLGYGHKNPQDWGWKIDNSELVPIQTDLPPAPEHLLTIIRCNCQSDCSR